MFINTVVRTLQSWTQR